MSVTTSNDGTYQDSESGSSPFTRIVQQTTIGGSGFANASYIRLGGYTDNDENNLVTSGVTVTSSTVTATTYSSSEDYQTASLLSAEGSGTVTTAQAGPGGNVTEANTQSQNLRKEKVTTTPRTPLNTGILIYSDKDLQINTLGAAYMEFQSGHSTVLTNGDSNYIAQQGQVVLQGNHGLTIQAGVPAVASKAAMQAMANQRAVYDGTATYTTTPVLDGNGNPTYDYNGFPITVTTQNDVDIDYDGKPGVTEIDADLYIIASNNINQKAYGPLDEVTYGDAFKNVHGNSVDIFYGTSTKEVHGSATEKFFGDKHTWIIDSDTTGKLAASFSMFLGVSTTLNLALTVSLSVTGKLDTILGADAKIVVGSSTKTVVGWDTSAIGSGLKFAAADDVKVVTGIDFKQVTVDSKDAQFKLEICGGIDLKAKATGVEQEALKAKVTGLASKLKNVDSRIVALKTII